MNSKSTVLYPEIGNLVSKFDYQTIPAARKALLQPLIGYIQQKSTAGMPVRLSFICTHNSRRSHLSQIWAQTAAANFNLEVSCYSGGTQATALFPVVAKTLEHHGFVINLLSDGPNPVYAIKYGRDELPVIGFSKTYDDAFNPQGNFAAIMTCSDADAGCPFIAGAEKRIPITYDDPKAFDDSPLQSEKYHERSLQIAMEMFYVFSQIKK